MGLLSGLMGNASQKNVDKVERDLEDILVPGEQAVSYTHLTLPTTERV